MILDTLTEEAVFSKDCKNPVYITLMNGKSPLADIISKATGDYFTHACISFNSALDPLYSFGSKNDMEKGMGFSIAHVKDRAISRNQPYYSVYVMYVSDSAYAAMKERLKYFEKNKNKFKYDFKGLVDIFFNRSSENHSTKYFCSRFVMDIISQAMPLNKVASLWRPQQIESLSNISLVNRGFDLYNYDKKITEKNEKLIKQGRYNEDDIIFESDIVQETKSHLDKNFKKKSGINFEYIDIHNSKANKYLNNNFHKTNFKDKMKITNGEIVIDKDNDKLAGYIYIGGGDKSDRDYGFIETLGVKKAYRGYGLSNKLLDDAIKKYDAIDLTVYKNNEVAINLYKKHGFVIIGYGNSKDKSDYWMKLKNKLDKGDRIMNESLAIDTQKDYKTKDTLVLNQYTKIKLSDAVVRVYSSRQKSLENIKINNDTKGFIWVDNSNNCVVAVVNTEEKDDGYRWITIFEVFAPYKGKGLSHQLLKVATNELKATNLEVSEDNDLAVKEYKSLGFSQYKKSGKMIYMSLDKSAGDEPEEDDKDYDNDDFEESTVQELKAFKNPARALKMRHSRKQNIQTKLGNYGGNDNPSSAPDTTPPNQDNNNQKNPVKKKKSNSNQPSQDSSTNESTGRVALNFATLWPAVYREYVGNKFLTGEAKKQFTNFGFKAGWTYKSFYGFCLGFSNTLKLYDLENPKSMNKSEYSKFIHSMTQDEKFSKRYTVQEKNGGKEIWLVAKTRDTINKKEDLKKIKTESGDMVSSLEKTAEKARALITKEIFACKDCATAYDNIMTPMEDGYAVIGWNLNKLKAADLPSFDRCREAVFGYCKKVFEDTNPGYELLEDLSMNCFYIRSKN